jgi:apolipoprotein D and lipocalin family protein
VDLQRYAGLWYEIARYPNRFEQGCEGVTAEYLLRPEGGLSVINTCHRPGRETQRARGRARVVEGSGGARLQVSFAPAWIPFAWGDYWILEVSDGYETALVGTPSGGYLWILARTPSVSAEERGRLEAIARVNGFDPTRLETVSHPADRGGE